MYQCYLHNWFSRDESCPSCMTTTTIAGYANGTEVGEEKSQDELAKELVGVVTQYATFLGQDESDCLTELKSKYIIKRKP